MENATKALLIAAGMFFAILILSALVMAYNEISAYYAQEHEATVIEQAQKFNAKFENFHRDNIRGSDLISLMNKVIDYNATEAYFVGTDYERIRVTITLGNSILNQFKYKEDDGTQRNLYLTGTITNTTGTGVKWKDDKNLITITNTPSYLSSSLVGIGIRNISDTQLQQLTTGIGNIITNESEDWAAYDRLKRAELIKDVLGISYIMDSVTGISPPNVIRTTILPIKDVVSQYYQYMQFKRAYFNCTEMIYDTETNRVVEMNFKVKTKLVNGVEKVVFN